MNILSLSFRSSPLFLSTQKVDFQKPIMCIIGENSAGKSTFLHIINEIFGGSYYSGRDRINIEYYDIEYEFETAEINELFIFKQADHDFKKFSVFNNNTSRFDIKIRLPKCKVFFDQRCNKILKLYDSFIHRLQRYVNVVQLQKLGRKIHNSVERRMNFFIEQKQHILDLFSSLNSLFDGEDLIIERHTKLDYHNWFPDSIALYSNEFYYIEEEYFRLFQNFIEYRDVSYDRDYDDFCNSTYNEFNEIEQLYKLILNEIRSIDKMFSPFEGIYQYVVSNLKKNVAFIKPVMNERLSVSNRVFYNCLSLFRDEIYQNIHLWLMEEVNQGEKMSFQFVESLFGLLRTNETSELTEDNFQESSFYNDLLKNRDQISQQIKSILYTRDLHSDFRKGFPNLYYGYKRKYIIKHVERILNESIPKFDQKNILYFHIDEVDGEVIVKFKEKGKRSFSSVENTSSGRQWYLLYRMISLSESKNKLLLIDEPASFLHISAQQEILSEICSLDFPVIYSTHSPYLLPDNSTSTNLFLITRDNDISNVTLLDGICMHSLNISFGFSDMKDIIISREKSVILVNTKNLDRIRNSDIVYDRKYHTVVYDYNYDKFPAIIKFLNHFRIKVILIVGDKKISQFKNRYPKLPIYSIDRIISSAKCSNTLDTILEGIDLNE